MQWAADVVGVLTLGGAGSEGALIFDGIVSLAFALPSLACSARRLHDIGRSGWWILLALTIIGIFLLIFWWAKEGDNNENSYGSLDIIEN